MRKLNTSDIFQLTRLIKQIGLKEEIKEVASKSSEMLEDPMSLGFELIFTLIEKFSEKQSEKALYEFLAGPLEITAAEVEKMELFELIEQLKEVADIAKWASFLKLAVR